MASGGNGLDLIPDSTVITTPDPTLQGIPGPQGPQGNKGPTGDRGATVDKGQASDKC